MRNSLPHWALVLALTLAALPRAGSAGVRQVSLAPMFDTHKWYKPKQTFKLRFRVQEKASGAAVAKDDVTFFLRHGAKDRGTRVPARLVKAGVYEIPFAPPGPGQYAVAVAVRGTEVDSIAPVRLGVIGVMDGAVELGPEHDAEMEVRARRAGWKPTR